MPNWTNDQKGVIAKRGSNILVSAAAGSGKTAVLVERIITKIIEDKVEIDELLVVTFTKAAAREMKEKIRRAIDEKIKEEPDNEYLIRQNTLIATVVILSEIISTILVLIHHFEYVMRTKGRFSFRKQLTMSLIVILQERIISISRI